MTTTQPTPTPKQHHRSTPYESCSEIGKFRIDNNLSFRQLTYLTGHTLEHTRKMCRKNMNMNPHYMVKRVCFELWPKLLPSQKQVLISKPET